MSSPIDTVRAVQRGLEPYIRPREEAAHIRGVLAAHLHLCLGSEPGASPLALTEASSTVAPTQDVRGLQREYLKALNANLKVRREFEAIQKEHKQRSVPPTSQDASSSTRLEEHLATVKLQKKQERLHAVEKSLDILSRKPAGTESFLDPEEVFKDARPLPTVPKGVVDGFSVDKDVNTDLKDLVNQLEKSVLQAKLLVKREEQLLEGIKARSSNIPEHISDSVKLHALTVTRGELIAWIENELGKASVEGSEASEESPSKRDHRGTADKSRMGDQIASIKEKYAHYLRARKALIQNIGQTPQPVIKPQTTDQNQTSPSNHPAIPITYLLSPYLENLLSIGHEQKGLISQKSHLNVTLAKQLKDTCQVLDHLAEESQLLPTYPIPGSSRRKPGIGEGLAAPETLDASSRMKGWVFAADSAKIAALEAVAEKVEEGQLALEGSMKILSEIDQLLGRNAEESSVEPDVSEDDIWLAQGQAPSKGGETRRQLEKKAANTGKERDVWSILDGNLGLIRSDDDPS